jgi:hypothetical protein
MPSPSSFIVLKGLNKEFFRKSSGIPGPLSEKEIIANPLSEDMLIFISPLP